MHVLYTSRSADSNRASTLVWHIILKEMELATQSPSTFDVTIIRIIIVSITIIDNCHHNCHLRRQSFHHQHRHHIHHHHYCNQKSLISDRPHCRADQVQVYGVARFDRVRISCEVGEADELDINIQNQIYLQTRTNNANARWTRTQLQT